jgi:hypothetical protein
VVNAEGPVKIRQLTNAKSPFCFVVGVIMEIEQLLVEADPVNVKYSPLSFPTPKDMALQSNGSGLGCPHAKFCAVPKGPAFSKYILRMHDPYTLEALLIKNFPLRTKYSTLQCLLKSVGDEYPVSMSMWNLSGIKE